MKRLANHQRSIVVLCLGIWLSINCDTSAQPSSADLFGTLPEIQLLPPGGNLQSGIQAVCPPDITLQANNGMNGAFVTWDPFAVQTACKSCAEIPTGTQMLESWNGHRYFVSNMPHNWNDALQFALQANMDLAAINSPPENSFLHTQNPAPAYTGGNNIGNNGLFQWSNGDIFSYQNWAPGQPGPNIFTEYALLKQTDGMWYAIPPQDNHLVLLESNCLTATLTQGLAKGSFFPIGTTTVAYQISDLCGNKTSCSFNVTIECNLTIECPPDLSLNCENGKNGAHVSWNLPKVHACCDLCLTDTVKSGFIYMGKLGGSSYFCSKGKASWTYAKAHSENSGGYLVAINTIEENNFLANQLAFGQAWIGLTDESSEGNFSWINGDPLSFTNWQISQPDNGGPGGDEDYGALSPSGFWHDEKGTESREYIMEVPCIHLTQISGPSSGSFFQSGETTISYKAWDACGDTTYCSFKVIIPNCCEESPQINCPPNYTACPDTPMHPSVTGYATSPTPSDSCGNVIITYVDTMLWAGNCWDKIIKRTWKASYDSNPGLAATCQQTITLKDEQPPFITGCPKDITVQPDSNCHACIFWTPPTATDNCSGVTVSASHQPGFAFHEGTTTVTYTFTDACGNSSYCSFKITVLPCCEPPQITCPPNYFACPDTPINPSVTGYATSITPCGPCGNVIITYTDSMLWAGNCWDKIIKRTWKAAYDANPGVATTCQQTITLKDEQPPVIAGCPANITAQPDPNCHACIFWTAPTATDNCSGVTVSASHHPGFAFPEGVTTVTYTFTDACGNSSYCTFKITVLPCCEPPQITCPTNYFACPETSIDPAVTGFATSPTPSGSCGDVVITYSDSLVWTGLCWDKIIIRTWKAAYDQYPDIKTTCQQTITLEDDQPPVFTFVPDHLTICPGEPISFTTPSVSDECGTVILTFKDIYLPGSCKTGEKYTRTWTATDACGNQSFVLNTITVKDDVFPLFNPCPSDITVSPGSDCKATVIWEDLNVSDNCGNVTVVQTHYSGEIFEEGTTTVTYTATDLCGNISVCKFKITVTPCCTPPELKCPPKNMGCPGDPYGPEITGEPELIGFSNCGLLDLTYEDFITDTLGCPDSKAIGRIWTLTVVNQPEKKSTCEQWIMRRDDDAPEFDQCPDDIIIYTDKWCPIKVDWQEPVITDQCSPFEVETTHLNGDTYFPGTTTVQYYAEDECGNISFCFFDIVIIYSGAPPEGGYCLSYGERQEMLWIDSVYLNESLILSGEKCGVGFADAQEHVLYWGEEVSLKVIPELGMPGSAGYLRAWVDWDSQNGFDPGEEMIYHAQIPDGEPTTIKFNVPHTAPPGKSRIRISYKHFDWDSDPMPPLPCSVFKEGSVADIAIQIEVASSNGYVPYGSGIQLFPNPARDQVNIRSGTPIPHASQYEILNMLGQSVRAGVLEEGLTLNKIIDLQGIPAGIYRFLTLENGAIRYVLPLVIE